MKPKVNLSRNSDPAIVLAQSNLRAECSTGDVHDGRQNLPSLYVVIIDGLLANQTQVKLLVEHDFLEHLGNSERLQLLISCHICHDVDARVSPHSKSISDHIDLSMREIRL